MRLVTAEHMRQIEQQAIASGLSAEKLMENAGESIAGAILATHLRESRHNHVVIFSGRGNNGGDGFVVARHLADRGVPVTLFFLGPADQLSPESKKNLERIIHSGISILEVTKAEDIYHVAGATLVIDAILGSGAHGVPEGLAAQMVQAFNQYDTEKVAVDIPTGVQCDTGAVPGIAAEVHYTYTLGLPKTGLYVSPGREYAGEIAVVEIGLEDKIDSESGNVNFLIQQDRVEDLLPFRKPDAHKGDFGTLLVIAGSSGMTGAAELTTMSACRAGVGLVRLGAPASSIPPLASKLTEPILVALPDIRRRGVLALRGLGEVRHHAESVDALVIGPGLGKHHDTKTLVRRLIQNIKKPTVIDADALNAFEGAAELLSQISSPLILTPHPGEFRRLTGEAVPELISERIDQVRKSAARLKTVLVLKGSPTLIGTPVGNVWLNPTGNNGMATAGSGDVLAGILGSLMAQGLNAESAAICGVFLHGLAGDIARDSFTERGMIASDIVASIPEAFATLE